MCQSKLPVHHTSARRKKEKGDTITLQRFGGFWGGVVSQDTGDGLLSKREKGWSLGGRNLGEDLGEKSFVGG